MSPGSLQGDTKIAGDGSSASQPAHGSSPPPVPHPRPATSGCRPLRSWSSSEDRSPLADGNLEMPEHEPRRFSVAGPAAAAAAAAAAGGSGHVNPRLSRTMLALHTWAEEEGDDEMQHHSDRGSHGDGQATRTQLPRQHRQRQRRQRSLSHLWNTHDNNSRQQASSSCNPYLAANETQSLGEFGRLGSAPFSLSRGHSTSDVSIDSLGVGNPMGARPNKEGGSGPFAAKRSRASFCDAGPRTSSVGTPCFRPSNANNAGSGRGSSTCSASSEYQCAGHAPYAISIPSRVGSPLSFTQPFLASRTSMYEKPPSSQIRAAHIDWDGLMEERAACNNANSVNGANNANCDDWPMWQPQQQSHGASVPLDMACSNPRLSSAVVFKSHIAQHQQPQQQHCAPRQPALPIQPSSCSTNAPCPHLPWHACPVVTADPANGSAASAIVASGISGAPGAGTRVAHNDPECLLLMQELEQLQEWDFACQHHPLLMSFSAASQQKLSAAWRNTLLVALAASVLCVVAGVPLALALLASKEDSLLLAHKG